MTRIENNGKNHTELFHVNLLFQFSVITYSTMANWFQTKIEKKRKNVMPHFAAIWNTKMIPFIIDLLSVRLMAEIVYLFSRRFFSLFRFCQIVYPLTYVSCNILKSTNFDNNYLKLNWFVFFIFFFFQMQFSCETLIWNDLKLTLELNYAYCRLHCNVSWIVVIHTANWHGGNLSGQYRCIKTAMAHSN